MCLVSDGVFLCFLEQILVKVIFLVIEKFFVFSSFSGNLTQRKSRHCKL
jgi:hypothetical protein